MRSRFRIDLSPLTRTMSMCCSRVMTVQSSLTRAVPVRPLVTNCQSSLTRTVPVSMRSRVRINLSPLALTVSMRCSRVRINLSPLALTDAKFLLPFLGSVLGFNWEDLCTFSSSLVAVVDSRWTLMIPVCLLSQWRLQQVIPPCSCSAASWPRSGHSRKVFLTLLTSKLSQPSQPP